MKPSYLVFLAFLCSAEALSNEAQDSTEEKSMGMAHYSPFQNPSLLFFFDQSEVYGYGQVLDSTATGQSELTTTKSKGTGNSFVGGFTVSPPSNDRAKLSVQFHQDSYDFKQTVNDTTNEIEVNINESVRTIVLAGSFALTERLSFGLSGRIISTNLKAKFDGIDVLDESASFNEMIPAISLQSGSMVYSDSATRLKEWKTETGRR